MLIELSLSPETLNTNRNMRNEDDSIHHWKHQKRSTHQKNVRDNIVLKHFLMIIKLKQI